MLVKNDFQICLPQDFLHSTFCQFLATLSHTNFSIFLPFFAFPTFIFASNCSELFELKNCMTICQIMGIMEKIRPDPPLLLFIFAFPKLTQSVYFYQLYASNSSEFVEHLICMTICQIMGIMDGQKSSFDRFQKVIYY